MENKLEQLLNSLIEKGWKPFGEDCIKEVNYVKHHGTLCWYFWGGSCQRWKPIRELVSKESGLWQFVCKNKFITNSIKMREAQEHDIDDYSNILIMYDPYEYEYRLIESALRSEDELEDFLLQNIKIDE